MVEHIYALATNDNLDALEQLADEGYDLDSTDNQGDTAICVAIKRNDHDAYKTLIEAGAAPFMPEFNINHLLRKIYIRIRHRFFT